MSLMPTRPGLFETIAETVKAVIQITDNEPSGAEKTALEVVEVLETVEKAQNGRILQNSDL